MELSLSSFTKCQGGSMNFDKPCYYNGNGFCVCVCVVCAQNPLDKRGEFYLLSELEEELRDASLTCFKGILYLNLLQSEAPL